MEENLNQDPMNQGPVNPEPKPKSGKGVFVIVALMAVIIVVLVAYIMTNNSSESKDSGKEKNSTTSSKVSDSEKKKEDKEKEDDEEKADDEENDKDVEKNTSKKDKNTSKTDDEEDEEDDDKEENKNTSSSGFGKKDKNTANKNTVKEEVKKDDESKDKKETTAPANLSADWKSSEFTLNGKSYKINDDYTKFNADGWYVDLKKAGYEDGYILNKNDKVFSTIDFLNDKFDDADVNVGFINLGEKAKDVTECQVWAITVDNKYSDTPIDFTLPGGIKNGSTLAEVEAAYGIPTDESDIYRSEDLGYTTYTYDNDLEPQLRLTIWDEGGLTKFEYKIY